ncbi:type II secretion system GspH family protein [Patescibacteria group bacterium]|nr:type II secretion system GspH family protein [Patescibacteria group bacterium]
MSNKKTPAFTLIELLISIAIMAVITAAIIPSFGNFAFRNAVLASAEGLKNNLELLQSKSVAGVAVGTNLVSWGVTLDPLCSTSGGSFYNLGYISPITGWQTQKVVTLPGGVLVTCTGTQNISFERITGALIGGGSYKFYLSSDTNTFKMVSVVSAGSITVN